MEETQIPEPKIDDDMVVIRADHPIYPFFMVFWEIFNNGTKEAAGELARAALAAEARLLQYIEEAKKEDTPTVMCFMADSSRSALLLAQRTAALVEPSPEPEFSGIEGRTKRIMENA